MSSIESDPPLSGIEHIFAVRIPMEPVAKGRPRMTKSGHAFTPSKTRAAEAQMRFFVEQQINRSFGADYSLPLFLGPCTVSMNFLFKRPKSVKRAFCSVKPDLDNLAKSADCLNGLVVLDDAQIVSMSLTKAYAHPSKPAMVEIVVRQICPEKENKEPKKGKTK